MKIQIAAIAGLAIAAMHGSASAQDSFLGSIEEFPYNFCPRGWAPAHGQLLSISENTALFSLIGTKFGGDGRTSFALPDLRPVERPGIEGPEAPEEAEPGHASKLITCIAMVGIYPSRN